MHTAIFNRLTQLARDEQLATYSEVAPLAGLSMDDESDREKMSSILADIARHEESQSHPMLTAIVVHSGGDNNPGEGFFAIAKEFGHFSGSRDKFKRLQFWVDQVKSVHEHWRGQ